MEKVPVLKNCENCGKALRLKPSHASIRFCSKKCEAYADVKRPLSRIHNGKRAKKDRAGYVMLWESEHPNKSQKGWQYEHRLIVEETLGRYLTSDEHVHHMNGIKDDNRPSNLIALDAYDHIVLTGQEFRETLAKMRSDLAAYVDRFGALT